MLNPELLKAALDDLQSGEGEFDDILSSRRSIEDYIAGLEKWREDAALGLGASRVERINELEAYRLNAATFMAQVIAENDAYRETLLRIVNNEEDGSWACETAREALKR